MRQDGGVSADRAAWNMSGAGPSTGPVRSAPEGTNYIFAWLCLTHTKSTAGYQKDDAVVSEKQLCDSDVLIMSATVPAGDYETLSTATFSGATSGSGSCCCNVRCINRIAAEQKWTKYPELIV